MAGYDPKRPRPGAGDDEPAPVEALLPPAPETADKVADEVADEVVAGSDHVVGSNGASANGSSVNGTAPRPVSDVPVAPAPEEGTANRAVLAAVLGGLAVVAVLVAVLRRRRSG